MSGKTKPKSNCDIEYLEKIGRLYSKKLSKNRTKWESIIYKFLKELHISFEFQKPIICNKCKLYIVDFLFSEINLILEIDGKQFHSSLTQIKSDKLRTKALKKEGYLVIRLWNNQVNIITKENLNQLLSSYKKC